MDNHPIPQDVTGFQFKLIGAMTVKQFGYVAVGVILAVILYYMPLKSAFGIFFKIVFIPLLGGSGVAIAFLPIEGRPVDVMAANFIKALFSPNQFVYHKLGKSLGFSKLSLAKAPVTQHPAVHAAAIQKEKDKEQALDTLLHNMHPTVVNKLDEKEEAYLQGLTPATVVPSPTQEAAPPAPQAPMPQLQPIQQQVPPPPSPSNALMKQEENLTHELEKAKKEEAAAKPIPAAQSSAHQKVLLLEKQIQGLHTQKLQLDQELARLQTQLTKQQPAPVAAPPPPMSSVRNIPKDMVKKVGLPHVPDVPNVVVGIVKDPRGNVLQNMLVEIKDKDGNPVRAFKTNPLGQFASATPLAAGIYTIELEDPKKQHNFDVIQITANNQIMLPIEIISHDAREELRKQLFN